MVTDSQQMVALAKGRGKPKLTTKAVVPKDLGYLDIMEDNSLIELNEENGLMQPTQLIETQGLYGLVSHLSH